jgi:hypothetical protein
MPVTVLAGQELKLDAMTDVELTTAATAAFQYTIVFSLLRDATTLATVTVERDVDSQTATAKVFNEIPNLTWIDSPGAGNFIYTVVITVNGTNIDAADALTRAINAVVVG